MGMWRGGRVMSELKALLCFGVNFGKGPDSSGQERRLDSSPHWSPQFCLLSRLPWQVQRPFDSLTWASLLNCGGPVDKKNVDSQIKALSSREIFVLFPVSFQERRELMELERDEVLFLCLSRLNPFTHMILSFWPWTTGYRVCIFSFELCSLFLITAALGACMRWSTSCAEPINMPHHIEMNSLVR